jgi:hypothetical protein
LLLLAVFASFGSADEPATVDAAAAVLDLRTFPLPDQAQRIGPPRLASAHYGTSASPADAYAAVKKSLVAAGWTELPDSFSNAEYANGTLSKKGFLVSVSASGVPGAAESAPTTVSITQHGNVDPATLPKPDDLQVLYAGPVSSIYLSGKSVAENAKACAQLLAEAGWIPYGDSEQPQFYKKQAIRLTVFIGEAPAQDNQTTISYSAELMSADLDPPPGASRIQYADSTTALSFDAPQSVDDVLAHYRQALAADGWKPTTEQPVKIDLYDTLIFRNAAGDMLTLKLHSVDDGTRGLLTHASASEVAELETAARQSARDKAAADEEMRQARAAAVVSIPIPGSASNVQAADGQIEFRLPAGKASDALNPLRKHLADLGWTEEALSENPGALVLIYRREGAQIDLTCVDPGIIPAEITISSHDVPLKKQ